MLRKVVYGIMGLLSGAIAGVIAASFAEFDFFNFIVATALFAIIGGLLGIVAEAYITKTANLGNRFLDPRGMDALLRLAYYVLIGLLPLSVTNKLVSKLRDYLKSKTE